MLSTIQACSLYGVDAYPVQVEVDVAGGRLPTYHVVGLPSATVKEGSVRIRSALEKAGFQFPRKKITVNLAPADRRKQGAAFDLPIALAVMGAEGALDLSLLDDVLVLGELGLDGSLREVRGVLAAAIFARESGMRGILVPQVNAAEASAIDELEVLTAPHLADVVNYLRGEPLPAGPPSVGAELVGHALDLRDVRGQDVPRLALEVAVAGGHNVLLLGPPGIGKTMLARRIPSILPPLSRTEAIEVTKVYSSLGLATGLARERPFRAPHHSVSPAALVGGSSPPRAGEISMAHNGVLFLDEVPEFGRASLESLRQPLEDRSVVISRATGAARFPCRFLLAASANPCPCGWHGSNRRSCRCSLGAIGRYRNRLSGPLLDRIDLQVSVDTPRIEELRAMELGEDSATVRDRVIEARARQQHRLAPFGARTNAEMNPAAVRATCKLDSGAERTLRRLAEVKGLTGRAVDRVIKVARTVADLAGDDVIDAGALLEAASYRSLDSGDGPAISTAMANAPGALASNSTDLGGRCRPNRDTP